MYAMVMRMLLNGYGMMIYPSCCVFIWIPVIMGCWFMVYSLCFKSVCVDALWKYKSETVEDTGPGGAYSGESSYGRYSGCSGGGYTAGDGSGGCVYTGDDGSCSAGRYSGDGSYVGYGKLRTRI